MTSTYFIKGFIIGLSIAAPVGPIGVLTIKRTLTEGRRSGFVTGLGAAFADATYGAVAGFGKIFAEFFFKIRPKFEKSGLGFHQFLFLKYSWHWLAHTLLW